MEDMKMQKKFLKIFMPVVLAAVIAACFVSKKGIRPELLDGPGYTHVDNNLHQIDGPPVGEGYPDRAFRVYRSGVPDKETFAKWCSVYKIERVIVMSGTAEQNELAYEKEGICPDIEVVYNVLQNHAAPVSDGFLKLFDKEIERAKQDNVGILFRCETGSHRAGRTAAYYQMKYQGLTADEAIAVMDYNGMMMPLFNPVLIPQVRALEDYIKGRPCSQPEMYCVEENSNKWVE
jgi:hypothetical protein